VVKLGLGNWVSSGCAALYNIYILWQNRGQSRADRAQEADPKAQVGGSDPQGATANWHMGVVTPATHQLMRDTDYIYPPLEGIRGEQPEQERRPRPGRILCCR